MSSDPFADVLRVTEATSIVSGGIAAGGSWSLRFPRLDQIVFAAVVRGSCWLRIDGRKAPIRLEVGDVGLLSGRESFILCSDLRLKPVPVEVDDDWAEVTTIGDGTGCMWLAGRVSLQPASGALLTGSLPALVHIRASDEGAAALQWIVKELVDEHANARPGANTAVAQLAQLFFVKILRAHLANSDAMPPGWLRALRDERLTRALRLVHDDPARALRLDELAHAAGMSRTRFAVHFKAETGLSPLAYVTAWRMRLAQRALRDEEGSIEQVAASLGYSSSSAFSIAFKRVIGVAPSDFRASQRRGFGWNAR